MKFYYPYKSDKPDKKFYIITSTNKKVYFGASGYNDYIIYNEKLGKEGADKKRELYIKRHSKMNEDWGKSGINTAGWWSRWFLWEKRTLKEAYKFIENKILI